jgi:hypothetical protein
MVSLSFDKIRPAAFPPPGPEGILRFDPEEGYLHPIISFAGIFRGASDGLIPYREDLDCFIINKENAVK